MRHIPAIALPLERWANTTENLCAISSFFVVAPLLRRAPIFGGHTGIFSLRMPAGSLQELDWPEIYESTEDQWYSGVRSRGLGMRAS